MSTDRIARILVDSPLGELLLTSDESGLIRLDLDPPEHTTGPDRKHRRDDPALRPAAEQLAAYFAGELQEFRLSLVLRGTEFQRRVWEALLDIPYGETISYAELARRIGAPSAVRAVGGAVGRNPIAIIVPCHRVVGSSGALTGYGGGLERKRWLLAHERGVRADMAPTRECGTLFPV
jgi:methylated-DNA-[protein]-cysteine S-methyltransferase